MHSVIYRTQLLRDCNLELPKHTFYVDNIFVYQPLPYCARPCTTWTWTCTATSSAAPTSRVNEKVMVTRVDQQLRVTYHMIDSHDLRRGPRPAQEAGPLYVQLSGHDDGHFLHLPDHRRLPRGAGQAHPAVGVPARRWTARIYHKMKYRAVSAFTAFPGYQGRRLSVGLYRLARKIYKFN